jgi:hypothetical protein
MVKIRPEQMQAFDKAAQASFEDDMVKHLKDFSPKHTAILGEPAVRKIVRSGIDQAHKYNFTNRGPVRLHLELIFMVGSDYPTDPQYPEAAVILGETTKDNQMRQAERLHGKAMEFIKAAAGTEREHIHAARQRLQQAKLEDVPVAGPGLEAGMLAHLARVHPEKSAYVGEAALRQLIGRGQANAHKYGIAFGAGPAVVIGLMFGLGHGCVADPLYPWINNTLTNPEIKDAPTRIERLASKAKTYLDQATA